MSERDPVITLLRELDGPVDPRPEFADALRARLLEELAQTNGAPARHGRRPPRRAWPIRSRGPLLAGAVALAIAATVIAAVVVSRPSPASALDVIRQARAAFAHTPPFQALIKLELNPTGSNPGQFTPRGATQTVLVSYGGPHRFRAEVVGQAPRLRPPFAPPPGAYEVFDGQRLGSFDPRRPKDFESNAISGFSPLEFLSWRGAYPDWERVCRGPHSGVLPDTRIVGRDARHLRCEDFAGDTWELWIDRQTGLMLKIVGRVGGGDVFLGGGPSTSARGGLEVERLRYNPTFSRGTFSVTAPPGAFDRGALRRATLAELPPFRAVVAVNNGRRVGSYVDEDWWLNERTWRSKTLVDHQRGGSGPDPNDSRYGRFTGAGSFSVMAHGIERTYDAHDHTFSRNVDAGQDAGAAGELLGYLDNIDYSPARCPIVGHERIAGRETDHRRCGLWIDSATGLALRAQVSGHDVLVVRSIEYHPRFPAGIFRFVPPPGSHDLAKLEASPYYKTKLAPGKPAPNWHATTLAGKPFRLADLRGRPALLLLVPDDCSDPACNDLAPLERAYQRSTQRTQVVWVDVFFGQKGRGARKVARLNHLTFPIVIDHKEASYKAWAFQGYPYWLLLDSHGRVVEARFKPQTVTALEHLLSTSR